MNTKASKAIKDEHTPSKPTAILSFKIYSGEHEVSSSQLSTKGTDPLQRNIFSALWNRTHFNSVKEMTMTIFVTNAFLVLSTSIPGASMYSSDFILGVNISDSASMIPL